MASTAQSRLYCECPVKSVLLFALTPPVTSRGKAQRLLRRHRTPSSSMTWIPQATFKSLGHITQGHATTSYVCGCQLMRESQTKTTCTSPDRKKFSVSTTWSSSWHRRWRPVYRWAFGLHVSESHSHRHLQFKVVGNQKIVCAPPTQVGAGLLSVIQKFHLVIS